MKTCASKTNETVLLWTGPSKIQIKSICLMRVTLDSLLRLTNLWPSDSRSNWNLEMLVFEERAKPEYPEKTFRSKDENQQQTQPTYDAESGNRTRTTLVGGECSHRFANPPPLGI